MNIQQLTNSSSLRKGLGWTAALIGVAILTLLVACPAASSNDDGSEAAANVAPTFTTTTVAVEAASGAVGTSQSVTITIPDLSEASRIYWQVYGAAGTALDAAGLVAATANADATDTDVSATGSVNVNVTVAMAQAGFDVGPLTVAVATPYTVLVIAQDTTDATLVSAISAAQTFTSGPAAPILPTKPTVPSSVVAALTGPTSGNLSVSGLGALAGNGTVHWAVYASGVTPGGVDDVKAGTTAITDGNGDVLYSAVTAGSFTATVPGIVEGTMYRVYLVLTATNSGGSTDSDVHYAGNAEITATDAPPDGSFTIEDGFFLNTMDVRLTNDGVSAEEITTAKYIIYRGPALSPAPDYAALNGISAVSGTTNVGDVVALGSFSGNIVAGASQEENFNIEPTTQYTVYVIVADNATPPNGAVLAPVTLTTKAVKPGGDVTLLALDPATDSFRAKMNNIRGAPTTAFWSIFRDGVGRGVTVDEIKNASGVAASSSIKTGKTSITVNSEGEATVTGTGITSSNGEIESGMNYDIYIVLSTTADPATGLDSTRISAKGETTPPAGGSFSVTNNAVVSGDIDVVLSNSAGGETIASSRYVIYFGEGFTAPDYATIAGLQNTDIVASPGTAGNLVAFGDFRGFIIQSTPDTQTVRLVSGTRYTAYVAVADFRRNGAVLAPIVFTTP